MWACANHVTSGGRASGQDVICLATLMARCTSSLLLSLWVTVHSKFEIRLVSSVDVFVFVFFHGTHSVTDCALASLPWIHEDTYMGTLYIPAVCFALCYPPSGCNSVTLQRCICSGVGESL